MAGDEKGVPGVAIKDFKRREEMEAIDLVVTVLVVDDDFSLRCIYKEIIEDVFGWKVVMAVNAEDGWREFLEKEPDLVITDLRMETPDAGLKLAKKIKNISNVPVIMITGEEISPMEKEVDCLIFKPFGVPDFIGAIKKIMN